jgi:hypothetical protein
MTLERHLAKQMDVKVMALGLGCGVRGMDSQSSLSSKISNGIYIGLGYHYASGVVADEYSSLQAPFGVP